jgi:hypothetical protein
MRILKLAFLTVLLCLVLGMLLTAFGYVLGYILDALIYMFYNPIEVLFIMGGLGLLVFCYKLIKK